MNLECLPHSGYIECLQDKTIVPEVSPVVGQLRKSDMFGRYPNSCRTSALGALVSMPDGHCAFYAVNMVF